MAAPRSSGRRVDRDQRRLQREHPGRLQRGRMIDRDRPVRPEADAERGVELQVAQAVDAEPGPLRLHLGGDALHEVDQVERRVTRCGRPATRTPSSASWQQRVADPARDERRARTATTTESGACPSSGSARAARRRRRARAARVSRPCAVKPSVPIGRCGAWNSRAPSGIQATSPARARPPPRRGAGAPAGPRAASRTPRLARASVDEEAAVDVGDLARDVAGVLASEERDERGDLVDRPEPPDRDAAHEIARVRRSSACR